MDIKLNGKRALVTGAGKGIDIWDSSNNCGTIVRQCIGRAIAKQLAAYNAETFAVSRTLEDLQCLKAEVPAVHIIQLDITDWNRTREELTKIGPIDLLINNAGIGKPIAFLETSKEELKLIMDTNFIATFNVSQVIAKTMAEKGKGGAIVNISSICSRTATNCSSAYSSSKAAMDMLTKCMALELGPANIRVNSVNPTIVWTDMALKHKELVLKELGWIERTPLGHFAEIEDVVNAVMYLLSDTSCMINGENIRIDGGLGVN